MKIIDSYANLEIPPLHKTRLFYLLRPLLKFRRHLSHPIIKQVNQDLIPGACILDSAGWIIDESYYIVESDTIAKNYCEKAIIMNYRYDSLDFDFVFAYNPHLLRYIDVKVLENFINSWTKKKMIIYLDKRTIFHNYLKYDLRDLLSLEGITIKETKTSNSFLYKWEITRQFNT
jgi:hypothetical protein